ncbi:BTAD domain-containing putative transcriptional regulator [Lentzea sp. NPDC059081]|uniref:AfsR/SARP family transcriptional regulator n=1 Tax=Lentzea sp. NPDC059081 TaxID=3346719 RepID=UPI0036C26C68
MKFGILGPLEVWDGDEPLTIGGPQQRHLLAVLLLNANQVVSAERLIEQLWGSGPPASARQLLKGCVLGLRRALRVGRSERLITRAPGYLLRVGHGERDVDRAEELAAAAARQPDGSAEQAADLLREALSCWRGPVLDGLDAEACRTEAARLAERRLALLEERIEADLRLGRYLALVAELQTLVREHPLRERLWAQLILALSGAGRQADALVAYRRIRRSLVDQLAVEPSAVLRAAHRAVLAGEVAPSAGGRVPAQLPAAPPGLVGRTGELAALDRASARGLVLVSGPPGAGKSALATHWAHQVRDRFPDGQLHLDLRGHGPGEPLPPAVALVRLLTALGQAEDELPPDEAGLAACFRTAVAARRLLLVLDDAHSFEQVRPLLPGSPTCLTVVTSRNTLPGLVVLDGAHRVALGCLSRTDSLALLRSLVGGRPGAEAVAGRCGGLPLALRIAAELATTRPLADLAADLADPALRLDLLDAGEDRRASVREAFEQSYRRLPATAARLFVLLGTGRGADAAEAVALAGTGIARTWHDLGRLVRANLVEAGPDGRYAVHGLLRDFAAARSRDCAVPGPDRDLSS